MDFELTNACRTCNQPAGKPDCIQYLIEVPAMIVAIGNLSVPVNRKPAGGYQTDDIAGVTQRCRRGEDSANIFGDAIAPAFGSTISGLSPCLYL